MAIDSSTSRAMSTSYFSSCRRILSFFVAAALSAGSVMAADTLADLRKEVAGSPAGAPGAVVRAIRSPQSSKPHWAARVTVAALQGLGPEATARQAAAIVFAAVRVAPEQVLEIVHAATLASPSEQAPNIAAAAAAASPHPFRKITYRRDSSSLADYNTDSGRHEVYDGKSDTKAIAPAEISPAERTMTLAEAIVDAAGGSWAVLAAVDATLVGSPEWLLGAMTDSSMLAAIGDSGLSNYGNEPITPVVEAPKVPPLPPVSP
jgi:hypothetical protein